MWKLVHFPIFRERIVNLGDIKFGILVQMRKFGVQMINSSTQSTGGGDGDYGEATHQNQSNLEERPMIERDPVKHSLTLKPKKSILRKHDDKYPFMMSYTDHKEKEKMLAENKPSFASVVRGSDSETGISASGILQEIGIPRKTTSKPIGISKMLDDFAHGRPLHSPPDYGALRRYQQQAGPTAISPHLDRRTAMRRLHSKFLNVIRRATSNSAKKVGTGRFRMDARRGSRAPPNEHSEHYDSDDLPREYVSLINAMKSAMLKRQSFQVRYRAPRPARVATCLLVPTQARRRWVLNCSTSTRNGGADFIFRMPATKQEQIQQKNQNEQLKEQKQHQRILRQYQQILNQNKHLLNEKQQLSIQHQNHQLLNQSQQPLDQNQNHPLLNQNRQIQNQNQNHHLLDPTKNHQRQENNNQSQKPCKAQTYFGPRTLESSALDISIKYRHLVLREDQQQNQSSAARRCQRCTNTRKKPVKGTNNQRGRQGAAHQQAFDSKRRFSISEKADKGVEWPEQSRRMLNRWDDEARSANRNPPITFVDNYHWMIRLLFVALSLKEGRVAERFCTIVNE